MTAGRQKNTKLQLTHIRTDTHRQVYFVIYISNWADLAHWKGKSAHERFSIFNISSHLFLCGGIRYPPRSPSHTQPPFLFFFFSLTFSHSSLFFIWLTGLSGFRNPYSLIGTLCALSSTQACHRYGFSYPSHHHCCPKTNGSCQSPQGRGFRGITFYCLTFFFFVFFFVSPRICGKSDAFTQIVHKLPWATCQDKG